MLGFGKISGLKEKRLKTFEYLKNKYGVSASDIVALADKEKINSVSMYSQLDRIYDLHIADIEED